MASLLYKLGIKEYTDRFKAWIEGRISQEHIYFKYEVGENLVYFKGPSTEGKYLPLQPWVLNMTSWKPITPHMIVVDEPAADGKVQVVSSNKFEVAINKLYDFILTWVYNDLKYTLHFEGEPGAYQQVITTEPYVSTEDLQESKVDKVEGLGLSQENFTTEDKEKLEGLENYDDTEIKQELTNLSERVEENEVLIEDLQNTKIDKEADDYYPQLSVGLADNLAGVDEVASEVSFRRSGGGAISDGAARIETLKGNSVVWNQLVTAPLFDTNSAESWLLNQGIVTPNVLDNGEVYLKGTGESVLGSSIISPNVSLIAEHTYLYAFDVKKSITGAIGVYLGDVWNNPSGGFPIAADTWYHVEKVATPTTNLNRGLWIYPWNNSTLTDSEAWIKNVVVYDLTQMFGAGNEPTTIEEFYACIPMGVDLNAYNDGEVIHMDVQSLESVGVNQWDEEWESGSFNVGDGIDIQASWAIRNKNYVKVLPKQGYYFKMPTNYRFAFYDVEKNFISSDSKSTNQIIIIPDKCHYLKFSTGTNVNPITTYNHDICINLFDASVNGKYFPYVKRIQSLDIIRKYFPEGMRSAGTAHDEIRYNKATQKWEKVQRIGSVDMGSLSWYTNVGIGNLASTTTWKARMLPLHTNKNGLCKVYPFSKLWVAELNTISFTIDGGNYYIGVTDPSYENAASFKAAMQGVILYYELAEPIVTELDDDFNLDYEVWNSGTEEVISDEPTTPLKADIAYGFNAVGKIKDLEQKKVSNTDLATINGQRIDEGGNIEIEASEGTLTAEEVSSTEPTAAFPQVLYTAQSLSDAQKSQARENIGVDKELEGLMGAMGEAVNGLAETIAANYPTRQEVSDAIASAITNVLNEEV